MNNEQILFFVFIGFIAFGLCLFTLKTEGRDWKYTLNASLILNVSIWFAWITLYCVKCFLINN